MFTFSLGDLDEDTSQQAKEYPYRTWEEAYRGKWQWDRVASATHCVDCYPTNCPYRVYVKDGQIWYGEARGTFDTIENGVPDFNPMGCQKGVAWSELLTSGERLIYPMKRTGERGEGKWQRVTWDEALTEVCDAMLDAIQEVGPESIISLAGCGSTNSAIAGRPLYTLIAGTLTTDLNAEMNDFSPGFYLTWGKFDPVSSVDDWFHAELTFIWFSNPMYTRIPHVHFALETRYKGGEIVTVAPDFSPSAIHSDYHLPIRPGTDAAFALSMCKVIIDEKLYNAGFVKDQTDLPLLVRTDNRRFLRASDVVEGGRDDQFYFYDAKTQQIVEAPRGTLALGEIDPALEGSYSATLKDGSHVSVTPVFELVKERLQDYTPERAYEITNIHADIIRTLARKAASRRTNILTGLNNAGKHYHGDLIDRAVLLFLGLTGNWGRKGTGVRCWLGGLQDGMYTIAMKRQVGMDAARQVVGALRNNMEAIKAQDPTMTDEIAAIEMAKMGSAMGTAAFGRPRTVPPVFVWYHHAGYKEVWNRREFHDPTMMREFDEYFQEAVQKGWWKGVDLPNDKIEPRVLFQVASNSLRRTRGGQTTLLKHLWPKLKMVVTVDYRMSTTAHYSDILLPCSAQYEKFGFGIPTTHVPFMVFGDKVVDPPGEAKSEIEIWFMMARKLEERAKARGMTEYKDAQGGTHRLDTIVEQATILGGVTNDETLYNEMIQDCTVTGTLPEGTTIETLREKGFMRWTGLGIQPRAISQASEIKPDETFNPYRDHTEKKKVYPTLTRRAQFYIDHDWFFEAGEELPVHKEAPKMGGDHPFVVSSGHNRWSVQANNIANRVLLQTHRGRPHLVMNSDDAAARGIQDNEEVRIYNDLGSYIVPVKLSPAVRPGQVICYNGWEPYQFRGQYGPNDVETGMVKWLQFAGGYGHLRYWPMQWQPVPVDRNARVDVAKID